MPEQIPVYVIALLKVDDMEALRTNYAAPLQEINARHGVEVLIATPRIEAIEGKVKENAIAILRFPSQASLDAWYSDPDYVPLINVRKDATDASISRLLALTPPDTNA